MYVIIVGGGKVGSHLAQFLLQQGHRIRLIENQASHLARLQHELPAGILLEGSGSEPAVLEWAGARQADVVAAVTGYDETNLVVCSLARQEFQVPRIIARVNNPKNRWLFTPEMGVDVVVDQADLITHLVVEEMSLGEMVTLFKLHQGRYALVEESVHADAQILHRPLSKITLPDNCAVVAVLRQGEVIIPKAETELAAGDKVLALVNAEETYQLAALLGTRTPLHRV